MEKINDLSFELIRKIKDVGMCKDYDLMSITQGECVFFPNLEDTLSCGGYFVSKAQDGYLVFPVEKDQKTIIVESIHKLGTKEIVELKDWKENIIKKINAINKIFNAELSIR